MPIFYTFGHWIEYKYEYITQCKSSKQSVTYPSHSPLLLYPLFLIDSKQ